MRKALSAKVAKAPRVKKVFLHGCECGKTFKSGAAYQEHVLKAHPISKEKEAEIAAKFAAEEKAAKVNKMILDRQGFTPEAKAAGRASTALVVVNDDQDEGVSPAEEAARWAALDWLKSVTPSSKWAQLFKKIANGDEDVIDKLMDFLAMVSLNRSVEQFSGEAGKQATRALLKSLNVTLTKAESEAIPEIDMSYFSEEFTVLATA